MFGADYNIYSIDSNTQADLTILRNHLEAIFATWRSSVRHLCRALPGTVSGGNAVGGGSIAAVSSAGVAKTTLMAPREVARLCVAVIAGGGSGATAKYPMVHGVDLLIIDRPGRTEQEVALAGGLTPLEVGPAELCRLCVRSPRIPKTLPKGTM